MGPATSHPWEEPMSTASNKRPEPDYTEIIDMTLRACRVAREAAGAAKKAVTKPSPGVLDGIKELEEELDCLDRDINEGVTLAVSQVTAQKARELLACLKLVIELERIGDLLLSFSNRLSSCIDRLDPQDAKDLVTMASIVERMLSDAGEAYSRRSTDMAVVVLRADAELDRIRNLIVVRHIENPEGAQRQESFHVVFMAQSLERAGDHAKNVAEEVVHLVTGRSVRHLLRSTDKPIENMFVDYMRKRESRRR
jgi:phosphate transport system protein